MHIRSIGKSERINRCCGVFGHTKRPQDECRIYEKRPICDMLSWTNSGDGYIRDTYVCGEIDTILPATKAERAETQVIPQASFWSKPTLGIKLFWIWEHLRVVGNCPANNDDNTSTRATPPLDIPMISDDCCTFGDQIVIPYDISRCTVRES